MDAFFPTAKIYNPNGQNYLSVDRELVLAYKECPQGQILHAGINEAGAVAAFTAAGTSYATHGEPLIPVYVFYSMFGFQRTGDSFWAAGDQMARGFIIGATAGRTTLTGEGLQHADGHSHARRHQPGRRHLRPGIRLRDRRTSCADGLERMYGGEAPHDPNVMYYLTVYNEPIVQPAEPEDLDVEGIVKGIYLLSPAKIDGPRTQILASGVSVPWALEAQRILAEDWGVSADVWSVTSWTELRRDAMAAERGHLPQPRPARPCPVRDPAARRRRRSGRRGHRLHEGRAGPDPPVPAERVRLARRGRLRLLRHPAAARRFFKNDSPSIVVRSLQMLAAAARSTAALAARPSSSTACTT